MPARPVESKNRIEALDVLRGLAIFGILVVNVEQMFLPLAIANDPVAMIPGERWVLGAWGFTDALFESKFITLFSLLFGIGFCLQLLRADDPRSFRRLYLRRILILMIFGLLHAAFFYKADVLVIYALTALVLMPLRRLSARALGASGGVLLVLTLGWGALIGGPDDPESIARKGQVAADVTEIRATGTITLPRAAVTEPKARPTLVDPEGPVEFDLPMPARAAILVLDGRDDFEQAKVDYAVFTHGPISAATFSRLSFLALLVLIYTPFYLLWRTLALFLIGAAIVKSGWLDAVHRSIWRRTVLVGFGLGLPMTLVATLLHIRHWETQGAVFYAIGALHDLSSLALAAGIGATALWLCTTDRARRQRRALAAVGRTALTNYIGQSVAMSVLATSYGLGLFGDLTRLQILALAVLCFALQVVVSSLWLRAFRIGPLEWVWRCLTYWRQVPLRQG